VDGTCSRLCSLVGFDSISVEISIPLQEFGYHYREGMKELTF
jgi:hypothetical protein